MAKWKEIKKYLVESFPEGWLYSKKKVSNKVFMASGFLIAMVFIIFFWLAINAPVKTTEVAGKEVIKAGGMKWRWLGMIYAVMSSFALGVVGTELVLPEKFRPVSIPMPGSGDWSILECVVVGVSIAGGATLVSSFAFTTVGVRPFALEVLPKSPLANWFIIGFCIPIIEEGFFGGVISSTFTENFGLLTGLTIPSAIFALFHWSVYGLTPSLLMPIFLFRSLATLSMVFSRSWMPGLVGHIIVNSVSTLAVV